MSTYHYKEKTLEGKYTIKSIVKNGRLRTSILLGLIFLVIMSTIIINHQSNFIDTHSSQDEITLTKKLIENSKKVYHGFSTTVKDSDVDFNKVWDDVNLDPSKIGIALNDGKKPSSKLSKKRILLDEDKIVDRTLDSKVIGAIRKDGSSEVKLSKRPTVLKPDKSTKAKSNIKKTDVQLVDDKLSKEKPLLIKANDAKSFESYAKTKPTGSVQKPLKVALEQSAENGAIKVVDSIDKSKE